MCWQFRSSELWHCCLVSGSRYSEGFEIIWTTHPVTASHPTRCQSSRQLLLKMPQNYGPGEGEGVWIFLTKWQNFISFHVLGPILLIQVNNQSMHTYISNITPSTLCHSDMFQPSKGHLQGANRYISTARSTKWVTRCKIQPCKQCVIHPPRNILHAAQWAEFYSW